MADPDYASARDGATRYVQANFAPSDRLAVVLINKQTPAVIQRITTAQKIAGSDFQAWLQHRNAQRFEIYLSMNALHDGAHSRTKADVAAIRHIYLDFDHNGDEAVRTLFFKRPDLPTPSFAVNTSPGRWQVIWQVEGFGKEGAETLQRALARETGADPAATDCARVLRLPGFFNHKHARPYLVRMEAHAALAGTVYRPSQFPRLSLDERLPYPPATGTHALNGHRPEPGALSQSERDWAYAKRALARGESPAIVAAAIASYRRFEKHNPKYYAELTVQKAALALKASPTPADEVQDRT